MMFERSTEEHNGHCNYETWAFYTHVTHSQSLLNRALEIARPMVEQDYHPAVVGEAVIRHFREWATHTVHYPEERKVPQEFIEWKDASMMLQDVGSFWRVDETSVGRYMTEYVKESA